MANPSEKKDAAYLYRIFSLGDELTDLENFKRKIESAVLSETLEMLLLAGMLKFKSTETNLESSESGIRIRFKDAQKGLYEVTQFDKKYYASLVTRIKLKAGLKTNITNEPQGGRYTLQSETSLLEFEISTLPGAYGENILIRLLTPVEEMEKIRQTVVREKSAEEEQAALEQKPQFLKKQIESSSEIEEKLTEIQQRETETKAKMTAKKSKLPYLDLSKVSMSRKDIEALEEETVRQGKLGIIKKIGNRLTLAMTDPKNPQTQSVINQLKDEGFTVEKLYVVSERGFNKILKFFETEKKKTAAGRGVIAVDTIIKDLEKEIDTIDNLKDKLKTISITEIVEILLAGALKMEASDIHIEPQEDLTRIRYRLDGVLQDVATLDIKLHPKIVSRIKIKSSLKLNVQNKPQDGRFTIRQKDIDIEVRVSILPGAYGETIVMRLLNPETIRLELKDLGMRKDFLESIKEQLGKTTGSIITTGPTGSGKTTLLYAFIQHTNEPGIKVITIEDPVEYHISGISQTQVNPARGYTFANGLRSIVRQDPDVILVGEIRDQETAEIAMQAALTGHLVFSTLHTNDAAGAIPRLLDFGVKPQIIAPAINVIIAQRLVRRLCAQCKFKTEASQEEFELISKVLDGLPPQIPAPQLTQPLEIWKAKKCKECNNTGYKGRIGVFEMIIIDPEIEKLILSNPAISDVRDVAQKKGMATMYQDAYLKVLDGVTDTAEVESVLGVISGEQYKKAPEELRSESEAHTNP